ncbi:MAG: prepilin-type N-terminal cleavage/methylation domain-containing protein [Holophaga sp.]
MKNQKGFTLIELLLVLAIIGIISAIAVPALLGQRDRAKATAVKDNTSAIVADLQSGLDTLSDPPSERPVALQGADTSTTILKATSARDYVLLKPNFSGAKNPYGNGLAYQTAGAVLGTSVVSLPAGNTTDAVLTITGYYKNPADGATITITKQVPVN